MKLELIFRYYRYYLSSEYSTRFIRVIDREFPGLNLLELERKQGLSILKKE